MKKLIAALLAAVLLLLAGCVPEAEETVLYVECVGCYRDTVPSEIGGTKTLYCVDVIYKNEVYTIIGADAYYRALPHVYGQIWVRATLDKDGRIFSVSEVME